jgi:hypothetical protein
VRTVRAGFELGGAAHDRQGWWHGVFDLFVEPRAGALGEPIKVSGFGDCGCRYASRTKRGCLFFTRARSGPALSRLHRCGHAAGGVRPVGPVGPRCAADLGRASTLSSQCRIVTVEVGCACRFWRRHCDRPACCCSGSAVLWGTPWLRTNCSTGARASCRRRRTCRPWRGACRQRSKAGITGLDPHQRAFD